LFVVIQLDLIDSQVHQMFLDDIYHTKDSSKRKKIFPIIESVFHFLSGAKLDLELTLDPVCILRYGYEQNHSRSRQVHNFRFRTRNRIGLLILNEI
jgi:hypothetical protein